MSVLLIGLNLKFVSPFFSVSFHKSIIYYVLTEPVGYTGPYRLDQVYAIINMVYMGQKDLPIYRVRYTPAIIGST